MGNQPESWEVTVDSNSAEDFFTGDDGHSVLSSNSQTSTCVTVDSVDSLATIGSGAILVMHVGILCDYIKDHKSLSEAMILEASTYTQRTSLFVKHRFLVLLLRRQGKKDVWLRIDRLRSDEKSLAGFVAAKGRVQANDIAHISSKKEYLIRRATWENTQTYEVPPLLGDFRHFLLVLVAELVSYKLWPDNCWMFCSTLQQHLGEIGRGAYIFGKPQNLHLSPDVRFRVRHRVMDRYPVSFLAYAICDHINPASATETAYRTNEIFKIVGVRDEDRYLGFHWFPHQRQPGRFFLDASNFRRVDMCPTNASPETTKDYKHILFHARVLQNSAFYKLGDVLAVTETDNFGDAVRGDLLDKGRTVLADILVHGSHLPREWLFYSRNELFRIPTREENPSLKWMEKHTPILYHVRVLRDSPEGPQHCLDGAYTVGDVISVIATDSQDRPYLGIRADSYALGDLDFVYITIRWQDVFRIPAPQERPDLEFLEPRVPLISYVRVLSNQPFNGLRRGDILGIVAKRDEDSSSNEATETGVEDKHLVLGVQLGLGRSAWSQTYLFDSRDVKEITRAEAYSFVGVRAG